MKQRTFAVLAALILVLVVGCTKPATTAGVFDWPQWRGPDGNGQSRETEWDPAAIANPRILWTANVGLGYSNVVIQDARLYATGRTRDGFTVSCLDAATGKLHWKQPLETTFLLNPQATPAIEGRDLFILMTDGSLLALDARTGRQNWRKDLVADYGAVKPYYGFGGSPIVAGNLVILNANAAGMTVKRSTGELVWTSEAPPADRLNREIWDDNGATYMTPVLTTVAGRACVLVYGWRGLSARDTETGATLWSYDWRNYRRPITADPVVTGDGVFISNESMPVPYDRFSQLIRVADGKPELRWENHDVFCDTSTPLFLGGNLYALLGGPYSESPRPIRLTCLEEETGRLRWIQQIAGTGEKWASLTAAGSTLIILSEDGTLSTAAVSPAGFTMISRCDVLQGANRPRKFCTPPVLCNAKIYCRSYGGDLVCIDVSR